MHLVIIPLLIIAAIVGLYYAGDVLEGVNLSLPGLQEDFLGDLELRGLNNNEENQQTQPEGQP